MAKSLKTAILLLFLLFIFSCSKNSEEQDNSTLIEFGVECGWCGGTRWLNFEKGKVEYKRVIPCGENKGTENKSKLLDEQSWNELITCFDFDYFTTLDYNECNVCVDGCDEIIRITQNNVVHEIRYNLSDNIKGLELLQEKLRAYSAEF